MASSLPCFATWPRNVCRLWRKLLFARFPTDCLLAARTSSGWELTGRLLGREAARMWEELKRARRRRKMAKWCWRQPILLRINQSISSCPLCVSEFEGELYATEDLAASSALLCLSLPENSELKWGLQAVQVQSKGYSTPIYSTAIFHTGLK